MNGRFSTPVVLAMSSTMIFVGVVAYVVARTPGQVRQERVARATRAALHTDDRTPEAAAESFLDAWRRRAWREADALAVGEARARVATKREADAAVGPEQRAQAAQVWDALASAPLEVLFERSEEREAGQWLLSGVAAYDFVGQPYRREVEFLVAPVRADDGTTRYRVARMVPGRVTTPLPDVLDPEGD